jgi:hypothetical protein
MTENWEQEPAPWLSSARDRAESGPGPDAIPMMPHGLTPVPAPGVPAAPSAGPVVPAAPGAPAVQGNQTVTSAPALPGPSGYPPITVPQIAPPVDAEPEYPAPPFGAPQFGRPEIAPPAPQFGSSPTAQPPAQFAPPQFAPPQFAPQPGQFAPPQFTPQQIAPPQFAPEPPAPPQIASQPAQFAAPPQIAPPTPQFGQPEIAPPTPQFGQPEIAPPTPQFGRPEIAPPTPQFGQPEPAPPAPQTPQPPQTPQFASAESAGPASPPSFIYTSPTPYTPSSPYTPTPPAPAPAPAATPNTPALYTPATPEPPQQAYIASPYIDSPAAPPPPVGNPIITTASPADDMMSTLVAVGTVQPLAARPPEVSTVEEAERILGFAVDSLDADPDLYSIGTVTDGAVCLIPDDGHWSIFLADGGRRRYAGSFDNPEQAAIHFAGVLLLASAERGKLAKNTAQVALPGRSTDPLAEMLAGPPITPLAGDPPTTLYSDQRLTVLTPGTEIDRFGDQLGNTVYAARTRYPHRSLPPDYIERPYKVYRVRDPLRALTGTAIPWFGQPGGGMAYLLPRSIEELLREGSLVEIPSATLEPS